MVSDKELVERLRNILRTSDLSTTTAASIRRKLEEEFGVDLTEKKTFVRDQINLFLNELENENGENVGNDEEGQEVKVEEAEGEEEGNDEEGQEVKVEEAEGDDEEGASDSGDDGVEEEEEEEEKQGASGGGGRSRKRLNKSNNEVKKRGGGFTKLCSLSPELQEFLGVSELARTEVVKRLWAHIRENNLQDPSNKRKILCNGRLHNLFKVETIDMFQMNKALSKHILPLSAGNESVMSSSTSKPVKKLREDSDDSSPKGKRQKGGSSGFLKPLQLSDALTKFIGTGESELPRSDVVKRIWDYIKQNNLQDPADKRNIICDEKLKELFQVNSFVGFTVPKLLTAHFVKN